MNFPFFRLPEKNLKEKIIEDTLPPLENYEHSITDGGEFLDDAIRMKEQPLIYSEQSIAAASPKDL